MDLLVKTCRICLENNLQTVYYNIFDKMNDDNQSLYSNFIEEISHIKINTEDCNLPKWLCEDCANSLKRMFDFIITIQTTNNHLINLERHSSNKLEEEWIEVNNKYDFDALEELHKIHTTNEEYIVLNNFNDKEDIHAINLENITTIKHAEDELSNNEKLCLIEDQNQEEVYKSAQEWEYVDEEHLDDDSDQHYEETDLYKDELGTFEEVDDVLLGNACKETCKRNKLNKCLAPPESKTSTRRYLCVYCPRKFTSVKSLYSHEKIHYNEYDNIIYTCNICNRQYSTNSQLENHRKRTHKERDNICLICGNAFKLKNQLMNHMKLHLEKNINCPYCDKKYARQFDLNVHLRSHTGELPYACHLCEQRFAIKVRLTYHLQKHYGIKHQCTECSAEFNSRQKLKAHSFKHTGMPYLCELCNNRGFATRNVFKLHLRRVHNACMSDETLTKMFQRNTGKTTKIKQISKLNTVQIDVGCAENDEISSTDYMVECEIFSNS